MAVTIQKVVHTCTHLSNLCQMISLDHGNGWIPWKFLENKNLKCQDKFIVTVMSLLYKIMMMMMNLNEDGS